MLRPRRLSNQFVADLKEGILNPLLDQVKADPTLCLEIRENYINIYYRGGNLLRVSANPGGYVAFFDPKYACGDGSILSAMPRGSIRSPEDVTVWLSFFPRFKHAMDLFFGLYPKEEREAQQSMLRQNNLGGVSRATDYFICDIEYANLNGRFDLVAVHWHSNGAIRKTAHSRRLALIEAKFGDGSIEGRSVSLSDFLRYTTLCPGSACRSCVRSSPGA